MPKKKGGSRPPLPQDKNAKGSWWRGGGRKGGSRSPAFKTSPPRDEPSAADGARSEDPLTPPRRPALSPSATTPMTPGEPTANAWAGPSLADLSGAERANLAERLAAFYAVHNPERADKVADIIEAYSDRPLCMFPDLDKKYGTQASTGAEAANRQVQPSPSTTTLYCIVHPPADELTFSLLPTAAEHRRTFATVSRRRSCASAAPPQAPRLKLPLPPPGSCTLPPVAPRQRRTYLTPAALS
jgi:hypothetical protein